MPYWWWHARLYTKQNVVLVFFLSKSSIRKGSTLTERCYLGPWYFLSTWVPCSKIAGVILITHFWNLKSHSHFSVSFGVNQTDWARRAAEKLTHQYSSTSQIGPRLWCHKTRDYVPYVKLLLPADLLLSRVVVWTSHFTLLRVPTYRLSFA